jgi:PhoH-like ATPase
MQNPRKIFVADTNVFCHDPEALFKFTNSDLIIPITVLEEMDGLKKGLNEVGRNIRTTCRHLDDLSTDNKLYDGVTLEHGGTVKVMTSPTDVMDWIPADLGKEVADNRIIAVAMATQRLNQDVDVVLVSKDVNVRVKADALGLVAEDYDNDKVVFDEMFDGTTEVYVSPEQMSAFHIAGGIPTSELEGDFYPNVFVQLNNHSDTQSVGIGRYIASEEAIIKIDDGVEPSDLVPRNREQQYLIDVLMDDNIKLVTIAGKAGSGKSMVALAAALEQVMEPDHEYKRLLVARPVTTMGDQGMGFLPGDISDKLSPWMAPISDNVEQLMPEYGRFDLGSDGGKKTKKFSATDEKRAGVTTPLDELIKRGYVELESLEHIRGRSIKGQILLLDEGQNATPHEIKTIITRAGEGTKIIITGDPYQIDNHYLDEDSNGLTFCAERFKDQYIAAHITMKSGERSELAELAADLL